MSIKTSSYILSLLRSGDDTLKTCDMNDMQEAVFMLYDHTCRVNGFCFGCTVHSYTMCHALCYA